MISESPVDSIWLEITLCYPLLHRQFKPQCAQHGNQSFERGISVLRERIVQRLPPEAGLLGDLGHALRAGDIAERRGDVLGIVPRHRRLKEIEDVLLGFEVIGGIKQEDFEWHKILR